MFPHHKDGDMSCSGVHNIQINGHGNRIYVTHHHCAICDIGGKCDKPDVIMTDRTRRIKTVIVVASILLGSIAAVTLLI